MDASADLPAPPAAAPGPPAPAPAGSRLRRMAAPVFTFAGVAAAFGYVATVDPYEPGHYPVCPLFRLTGLLCPGCGGLRSAHSFATGDLAGALGANAVAVLGYFLFAGFTALWLLRAWQGRPRPEPTRLLPAAGWWAVGALVLAFSVLRNLPAGAALAP
ncbi:DUF2752 domain-containing protein [Streptomyces sp. NPDC097619]|uniref:DUF2752 domain-containing protein n=1 Tax=Streptomyces sp. NPDC097619 TaxID=3157228 RepID=UPI00331B5845